MKIIYPGSFDPITNGHIDIFKKILSIFDSSHNIKLLVMNSDTKKHMFNMEQRVELIRESIFDVVAEGTANSYVESFPGNINDYINYQDEPVIIVRGLRNNTDFDYEMMYESFTKRFGAQTIYLTPEPENIFVSSSLVRNLINTKSDFDELVPWK